VNVVAKAKIGVATLLLLAVIVTMVAMTHVALPCAGQCRSPYELTVNFRSGVSPTRGVQVLERCENSLGVVRIGWDAKTGFGLVWTTTFGRNKETQPLFACLNRSGLVANGAYPD
jgi:hypothetical protein